MGGHRSERREPPRLLVVGTLLVFAGLLSWGLYALSAGHEKHSYTHGGAPPPFVDVTAGHTYHLAIPGGLDAERKLGLDPTKLQCTAAESGSLPGPLNVVAETNTKALDRIGSFTAGRSGSFTIRCAGIGAVFVDDADDAGYDWSGLWLVLAAAALAVGFPLALAGLRALAPRTAVSAAREDDQVE